MVTRTRIIREPVPMAVVTGERESLGLHQEVLSQPTDFYPLSPLPLSHSHHPSRCVLCLTPLTPSPTLSPPAAPSLPLSLFIHPPIYFSPPPTSRLTEWTSRTEMRRWPSCPERTPLTSSCCWPDQRSEVTHSHMNQPSHMSHEPPCSGTVT